MHSLRTVWLVGLVGLSAVASGCSGPAAAGADTGASADEAAPTKKVKRTYDNPERPTTEQETSEIMGFCEATIECYSTRCSPDEQANKFKRVRVKSIWGKQLQKHFAGHDLSGVGRRLAVLVEQEGLNRKSKACREVMARFD